MTNMTAKRRTFHVDWDSPSHETGTVKRRPTSLNASLSISNNCFENVEYYEVKDCIGGYGLRLLKSYDGRIERSQDIVPEFFASKQRPNEIEGGTIKDNGNGLEHPRSPTNPRKKNTESNNEDSTKFKDLSHATDSLEETSSNSCSSESTDITEIQVTSVIRDTNVEESADLSSRSNEKTLKKNSKSNAKKEFGLKLSRDPFEWRSKTSKVTKVPGSSTKSRSLIPKIKTNKCSSKGRGIVNSSSESSGIGSPLSPLSPQKDTSNSAKDTSDGSIKTSSSKSSGFGSPDSPLSPESQRYTAFYLIEEQLEKLRNCPCEKRQAQVNIRWIELNFPKE